MKPKFKIGERVRSKWSDDVFSKGTVIEIVDADVVKIVWDEVISNVLTGDLEIIPEINS